MTKYIRPLFAVTVAAAIVALLTACGAATDDPPAVRSAVSSTGQIDENLNIDDSASTETRSLRERYFDGAMKAVGAVLDQGGSLTIKAYFSRGLHPAELLKTPVPTPAEASGVARAEKVIPIREAAETAIAEALGLAPRRPEIAAALKGMGGEGTDIAGALAGALEETRGGANPVVIAITDGDDARFTGHYGDSPRELAALVSPVLPQAAPGTVIGLVGIGATAAGTSTALNQRLTSAWRLVCEGVGARCVVSPSLDLGSLIGNAEGA